MVTTRFVLLLFGIVSLGTSKPVSEFDREVTRLKNLILEDLGLTKFPNPRKANVSAGEMEKMLRMYQQSLTALEEDSDMEDSLEVEMNGVERFYSYTNEGNIKDKNHIFFKINLGTDPVLLTSAKLRLEWSNSDHHVGTLFIYQLQEDISRPDPDRMLLHHHNTVFDQGSHWKIFDVTSGVDTWVENPRINYGFLIDCYGCKTVPTKAVLDVLVQDTTARSKRSKSEDHKVPTPSDCEAGVCCKQPFRITFKEIGWDWVIQPKYFDAFVCRGRCPYTHSNYASTHALILSIFSLQKEGDIPHPTCVPKRLQHLNLLHYDDKDPPGLVVTKQRGMIVKECACS